MYHFTDGGLRNIWLKSGYVEKKTPYGGGVSFSDIDGLTVAIACALCQKPGRLTGAEFRYIRSAMQYSQKFLGALFGYTEQAVTKWEKYGKVPVLADAALRRVFQERDSRCGKPVSVTEVLSGLDHVAKVKIILSVRESKWNFVVEKDDVTASINNENVRGVSTAGAG